MARRSISIDEKIEKKKEVVLAAKSRYDAAVKELDILMKKKRELQGKELLEAFANSDKSLEEILAFMSEKNRNDG